MAALYGGCSAEAVAGIRIRSGRDKGVHHSDIMSKGEEAKGSPTVLATGLGFGARLQKSDHHSGIAKQNGDMKGSSNR